MAGREAVSKELSTEEDARLLKVLSDDLYDTVLYQTDWDTVLSSLVKSGFVSEKRQKKLEKKTQGDAAAVFLALLKTYRSIRRGFLLALKETAPDLPSHNTLLSSLTKRAGVDMKSLEEEHTMATASPKCPLWNFNVSLDDHPSAIFSSAGGVLYSPVYGVTVYIPAGAILGEEQVEFRLVTEERKIRRFVFNSPFKGSILCSGVFEFNAKAVSEGAKFSEFHSDVWIKLPHCLSFIEGSLKDYSSAVVVSDSRGKVEVETQALFSEGYPYVNLPVRHFSNYGVLHVQRRFTWSAKHHRGKANVSMSKLANDFQKLSLSSGCHSGSTSSSGNSPITQGRHIRQAMTRSSSVTSSSSSHRQSLYAEVKTVTSRSFEQPTTRRELVHQHAMQPNGADDDTMDVDTLCVQEHKDCHSSLDQELLHGASMSLYACVYQPVNRHTRTEWTADIVFAPLLPQAVNALMNSSKDECDCRPLSFELDPSQMRSLCLKSKLPSDLRGWTVELDRTEIILEEFNVLSALLSSRVLTNVAASAPRQDASCSKVASYFPKSVARVCNSGAPVSLLYPIEVLRSRPLTHCFLSCMIGEDREEEDQQGGSQHRKRHCYTSTSENSRTTEVSSGASSAKREKVDTDVVWAQDQYLFVLLSILLPENTLSDVAKQLGLDELQLKHVQSIPPQSGVGEKMYDLFHRAVSRRSLVSFAQLQTCLSTLQSCQRLVSILDSYLIFRSSLDTPPGGPHEDSGYQLLTPFLQWAINQLNHSMLMKPDRDGNLIIGEADRDRAFLSLREDLCCVWKMTARLLGLKDSTIDELVTRYDVVDGPCECAYQMLHKWAGSCPTPSDVSYTRLHLVLSVIAHGTCAADAALTFVQNRVTSLSKS